MVISVPLRAGRGREHEQGWCDLHVLEPRVRAVGPDMVGSAVGAGEFLRAAGVTRPGRLASSSRSARAPASPSRVWNPAASSSCARRVTSGPIVAVSPSFSTAYAARGTAGATAFAAALIADTTSGRSPAIRPASSLPKPSGSAAGSARFQSGRAAAHEEPHTSLSRSYRRTVGKVPNGASATGAGLRGEPCSWLGASCRSRAHDSA